MTAPTITTVSLGTLTVGVPYSLQLTATGDAPITWEAGWTADNSFTVDSDIYTADGFPGLPAGLSLSSTGLLTGTPTTSGAYSATITATNAGGSDADVFAGTVESGQSSGGNAAYNDYQRELARAKRRKRELEELALEEEADRLEMLLAAEGRLQPSEEVQNRYTVREYAPQAADFTRRTQRAIDYALKAQTDVAYQLAARQIAQQLEDEEYALLLLLAAA